MFRTLLLFAFLLPGVPGHAHEFNLGALQVGHPYARPTPPGASAGAAYLSIANKGGSADRLMRVQSPRAGNVELHSMSMDGNIMRMRAVPAINAPAGATVKLEPGALHIMFTGLRQPFKAGERFPLTLHFEKSGSLTVEVVVEDAAPPAAPAPSASHAGH